MAITLHHTVFRTLANFRAEQLRDAGGITVPVLELLHDYACHCVGLERGSPVLIYLDGPPSGSLHFAQRESDGDNRWMTQITLEGMDPFWLMRNINGDYHHQLTWGGSGPTPTASQLAEEHLKIESLLRSALSNREMKFLGFVGE